MPRAVAWLLRADAWQRGPKVSMFEMYGVDDADHGGINRRAFRAECLAGGTAFDHDQHFLVDTGANAVHSKQRRASWLIVERQRLHEEQFGTFEFPVLLRRDDRTD